MEKKTLKTRAKQIAAFCTTVLSAMLVVCAAAVWLFGDYVGVYGEEYESVLQSNQQYLMKTYGVWILQDYFAEGAKKTEQKYADSNLRYKIRTGDKIISSNRYQHTPQSREVELAISSVHVEQPYPSVKSLFQILQRTVFVDFNEENVSLETIEEVIYNEKEGRFFFRTGNGVLIPVSSMTLSDRKQYTAYYYSGGKEGYFKRNQNGKKTKTAMPDWKKAKLLGFSGLSCEPEDVKIVSGRDFAAYDADAFWESVDTGDKDIDYENGYDGKEDKQIIWAVGRKISVVSKYLNENYMYYVTVELSPTLSENGCDVVLQQKQVIDWLYKVKYHVFLVGIFSAVIALGSFFWYCGSVYHAEKSQKGKKGIHKIPLEVLGISTGLILMLLLFLFACAYENLRIVPGDVVCFLLGSTVAAILAGIVIVVLFAGEIALRLREHIFWSGMLISKTGGFWKWLIEACRDFRDSVRENTSLLVKACFALAVFVFLQYFVLSKVLSEDAYLLPVVWFIWKLVEIPSVLLILLQLKKLQDRARDLAEGKLEAPFDTSKMLWELKKHGDYLNEIQCGVDGAVEEKIRSERFRTELITNVSHDIKTPLTSIINYIDLLQKEGNTEQQREEYLQVLERQSSRLKKLIEDLMEASKASTGNVDIQLQKCNCSILLEQIVGEFEEKLQQRELKLITAEKTENLAIMADSRHLWRVFDNLMNNICKYSQPGTRVYINGEEEGGEVRIIFRNTSEYPLNISSEELLERFVRGDSSRHTEGSGLGLSIAQNLVELMDGSLLLAIDGDLFKVTLVFQKMECDS